MTGSDPTQRLVVRPVPALVPRLALALGATVLALLAPVPWVPLLALGAAVALARAGDGAAWRAAGLLGLVTIAATLIVTPFTLVVLAGVPQAQAVAVAAAFAVRLAAIAFVGVAVTATLPPRAWLAGLRRAPRLALALLVTFRQVPEIAADAARIRRAQRGRGLLAGRQRWRPLALFVPLVARSLERADRLGRALVLAGWGKGRARPLVTARYRLWDVALLALGAALAVAPALL